MNYEIKNTTGAILYAGKGESQRDVVERAVRERVSLLGADLRNADLRGAFLLGADLRSADLLGADLRSADLRGADLGGADLGDGLHLVGKKPVLTIGPIGSRDDYCTLYMTDRGAYVRAGCFFGSLDEFAQAVEETHGDSQYGREYRALIALARVHAECWADK